MDIEDYLQKTAEGYTKLDKKISPSSTATSVEDVVDRADYGKVLDYTNQMKNKGDKFPMGMLDYSGKDSFSQEGIKRALAAEQAGEKSIPVLMVSKGKRKDRRPRSSQEQAQYLVDKAQKKLDLALKGIK